MKRLPLFALLMLLALSNLGCSGSTLPTHTELDQLTLIRAFGLDKGRSPGNIRITIMSKESEQLSGGGMGSASAQKPKAMILTGEAKTVFQAERGFQTHFDKELFWGHLDYILVGEAAAREDIGKYIDFLVRDHQIRGRAKIYIIKGATAEEFMQKSSSANYFLPDRLKGIGRTSKLITGAEELPLLDFEQWITNKYSSAIAPTLVMMNTMNKEATSSASFHDVHLGGYAAFRERKLEIILDKDLTRAENFILNRITSGVIEVQDPTGAMVALEIMSARTKISPVIKNGQLQEILVKVQLTTNIDELQSTTNIFTEKNLNLLTNQQSQQVKRQIEKVIAVAQDNNLDFIDMANVFSTMHPVVWESYKDNWNEIFPVLPIKVEVESKINRTYDIAQPVGVGEEEHK
jgi:spore germination protein KC